MHSGVLKQEEKFLMAYERVRSPSKSRLEFLKIFYNMLELESDT